MPGTAAAWSVCPGSPKQTSRVFASETQAENPELWVSPEFGPESHHHLL